MSYKLKYIISVCIYGTVGLILRYISFPSEIVALSRGVIGTLFIYFYLRIKGKNIDKEAIKKNLKWLIYSGLCLGINWVFLFLAYTTTTVAIGSLCNYLAPVIVVVLAPFIFKDKLQTKKLFCVAGALVGVTLISGVFSTKIEVNTLGLAFGLLAALGFVGLVICNKMIKNISVYDKAIMQLGICALTVLPYVLLRNVGTNIAFDGKSIVLTLLLGVVHTGIAYIFYFGSLSEIDVESVAILGYIEPALSVLTSVFILNESMDLLGWIGTLLILSSAVLSEILDK